MVHTLFDSAPLAGDPPSLGARLREGFKRLRRAWRYLKGALSTNDARQILLECRAPAGWHPLDMLMAEDVAQDINQLYLPHPELPRLIGRVCERLGREWKPTAKLAKARRDAIALVEDLARFEGLFLLRRPPAIEPEDIRPFIPKGRKPALLPSPSREPALATRVKTVLPPPAQAPFNEFDHETALAEGWILKRHPNRTGGTYITIEPVHRKGAGRPLSPADIAVWAHVAKRAAEGSSLHIQAIALAAETERQAIEALFGASLPACAT